MLVAGKEAAAPNQIWQSDMTEIWAGPAIDCPRGVAPERMPKADATGLAPKNRLATTLPHKSSVREGLASQFCSSLLSADTPLSPQTAPREQQAHSLVKSESGGLGLKTRRSPGRLCPATPGHSVDPADKKDRYARGSEENAERYAGPR